MAFDPNESYYVYANEGRYITLSAAQTTYPLAIGTDTNVSSRNFKVDWNGTAYITNGQFSGYVEASSLYTAYGSIGGWTIDTHTLSGGDLVLDSDDGSITGGILKSTNHQIKLVGNLLTIPADKWNDNQRVNGLYLGSFEGAHHEIQQQNGKDVEVIVKTKVVGLQNNLSDRSLVIENTPIDKHTYIRIGNQNQMNNLILSSGKMSIHVNSGTGSQSEHLVIKDQANDKIYLQFLNKNYMKKGYSLFYIPDDAHVAIGSMSQNGWDATDTSANLTTTTFKALTSLAVGNNITITGNTGTITAPILNLVDSNANNTITLTGSSGTISATTLSIPATITIDGVPTSRPVTISASGIDFRAVPAASQQGIYARFA